MQNSTQQQRQQHVPLSTVLVLNNVSAWELKRCVVRAIDADVLLHYCHTHSVLADTFSMLVTLSRVLQSETIEKLLERNFLQKGYSFCRPANTVKTLTTNYQQCSNSIRRYFFSYGTPPPYSQDVSFAQNLPILATNPIQCPVRDVVYSLSL